MAVDPRAIAATAEFSKSEAPVRLELTREGAAETSAGPDAGDRARIRLDWQDDTLVGVRIDGEFADRPDQAPIKSRRVFVFHRDTTRATLRVEPSAVVAWVQHSDAGEPVRLDWEGTGDPSGSHAGDQTRVRFDWDDGVLAGVRIDGDFARQAAQVRNKFQRVFTVHRDDTQASLIVDPSAVVARAEYSDAGAPVRIELDRSRPGDPAQPGKTVVELDWHDDTLTGVRVRGAFPTQLDRTGAPVRRVYRAQHQPNKVALALDPSAIPAIAEFDAVELHVSVKLDETGIRAPAGSGDIAAVPMPEEPADDTITFPTRREARFYQARRTRTGTILEVADIPPYYVSGFSKKLDVRDDWSAPFGEVADRILSSGGTLLGHDRLYTLWQAVRNVAHLGSPIVEVGVWRGGSTAFIAEAQGHFNKPGSIYSFDTFGGHPRVDPEKDPGHIANHPRSSVNLTDVKAYLGRYPVVRILAGDITETAAAIPDRPIAMMHLDVNIYPATRFCLDEFVPRLEPDGLIVVDDYGVTSCPGVKAAVDEFLAEDKTVVAMHLLTGQALLYRRK